MRIYPRQPCSLVITVLLIASCAYYLYVYRVGWILAENDNISQHSIKIIKNKDPASKIFGHVTARLPEDPNGLIVSVEAKIEKIASKQPNVSHLSFINRLAILHYIPYLLLLIRQDFFCVYSNW